MKINTDNLLNKKILLVTLESPFLDDQYVFPYLGILYLMSVAKSVGADVSFTDKFNIEQAGRYDVIGISCMTPQGWQAYRICRELKVKYPHIIVMLGGPHATNYLSECRKEPFDIIVTGDGEKVWEGLLTGKIKWHSGQVFSNALTESEMNSYPIPYRPKWYIDKYNYYLNEVRATTLVNSRGCPMRCAFCESGGTKPRWFSPEHFEVEIRSIVDLGIRGVMIFDDLFAMNPAKIRPYLEILKENNMVFRCFGHAKTMTQELAELLAESGCVEIGFGAESGSQEILDTVNKRTTVEQMHSFVETVIRSGMKFKAFFMIGLPGETEQTAKKSHDFIEKYRSKYPESFDFDLTVFFPYKGTLIGDSMRRGDKTFKIRSRQGLTWAEIDGNGYGAYKKKRGAADIVIETDELNADRIGELQKETILLSGRYADSRIKNLC